VTLPNGSVMHIHNVMCVPHIRKNLICMSTITNLNLKVKFFKTHYIVKDLMDHSKLIASRVRFGGLYKLDVMRKSHQALTSTDMSIEIISHKSYGHINYHDLLLLQK